MSKVKESLGEAAASEDFQVPRPAVDALATEYDALMEEAASFKASRQFWIHHHTDVCSTFVRSYIVCVFQRVFY